MIKEVSQVVRRWRQGGYLRALVMLLLLAAVQPFLLGAWRDDDEASCSNDTDETPGTAFEAYVGVTGSRTGPHMRASALADAARMATRVTRLIFVHAGSLPAGALVDVDWTPPAGAANYSFDPAPANPQGPPPFAFTGVAVQAVGATEPAIVVSYDSPGGSSTKLVDVVEVRTSAGGSYAGTYVDPTEAEAASAARLAATRASAAAWLRSRLPVTHTPAARASGLAVPTWWRVETWSFFPALEITHDICQQAADLLQGGSTFFAVRFPESPGGDPRWSPLPLVRRPDAGAVPELGLWPRGGPPDPALQGVARLRPDRIGFAENRLPAAAGERWMTLAAASTPPITCPDGLLYPAGTWDLHAFLPLDLTAQPGACEGCVLQAYGCYEGSEPPVAATLAARGLGLRVLRASFQGANTTCLGPIAIRLWPFGSVPDPPFVLWESGFASVTPPAQAQFFHVAENLSSSTVTINLSSVSERGLSWGFYRGTGNAPDLAQPITQLTVPGNNADVFWSVANVPAGLSGPEAVIITGTSASPPYSSTWISDLLWIGGWVAPPVDAEIHLEQDSVMAVSPVTAAGTLPDGSYRLAIVPNGTYTIGACLATQPTAATDVIVTGGVLPSTTVWADAQPGSYDLLALSGTCPAPVARATLAATSSRAGDDAVIVAGDDLGAAPGLVVTAPESAYDLYIPAAANTAGLGSSRWQTDVDVLNPGAEEASVRVALLLANQANPNPATQTVAVPPGQTVRLANILGTTFQAANAALGIETLSGAAFVNSRFYNTASRCAGTYGMYIPSEGEEAEVEEGDVVYLHHLSYSPNNSQGFRVNVGFVNATAMDTGVQVDLFGDSGQHLKTVTDTLAAYEHRQFTRIHASPAPALGAVSHGHATVRVTTPFGKVHTYAMLIENVSGDPIFIRPVRGNRVPVPGRYDLSLAAAANTPGVGTSRWQTDVDLLNPGAADATVRLACLRKNQANPTPTTADVAVPAGQTVRLSNVLGSTFLASNAALGLELLAGSVEANARYYNTASACGTFGMYVPAAPPGAALAADQIAYFHLVSYSPDESQGFRFNVGFMSDSSINADVEVALYGDAGELVKTVTRTLLPYEHRQLTRIHRDPPPATGAVTHGYATVRVLTPGAAVHTYSMLIDNRSGDPIFMLPDVLTP